MFPGVSVDMLKVFVRLLYGERVTVTQKLMGMVGDIARMVGISQEVHTNDQLRQSGTRRTRSRKQTTQTRVCSWANTYR